MATRTIKGIEALLPEAFRKDAIAVGRKLNRLRRSRGHSPSDGRVQKELAHLEKRLKGSIEKRSRRIQNLPSLNYNDSLPILSKKDDIIDTIKHHQVVIISGETGSGKTTQIPKFCLEAGRGIDGIIGCTQPRRIAATTVSRRIAEEFGESLGRSVGYKIRFQDKTSPDAYIKIMTDGILLAETQGDPRLDRYDTLIVDEAHERSLNIDFILGILKTLLTRRKDLKLIITSATIDTDKFSRAFDDAPIIEVSGRMYPVDVTYLPPGSGDEDEGDQTHVELAVQAVDSLLVETARGDMLIFMPTEQDIRETCELIQGRKNKGVTVLPLFARLSGKEQSRIFSQTPSRKIIVATNIAETSITIPGIRYVIDTGLARISRYMPRSRTTSLSVKPISQSSADQRKGRCGRVENGVCLRLYSEEDYDNRPLFTPPEVLRTNLAEVILRMIALKLGDPAAFPFIDSPAKKSLTDGFDLLIELGAIDTISSEKGETETRQFSLTERGILMAKLPIDPRLSRMLLEARQRGCLKEMIVIASALSVQDPWERPADKTKEADTKHGLFRIPSSDFMTLHNVWDTYHRLSRSNKSTGKMKRYCKTHFLSYRRMREWRDVHAQISTILKEQGIKQERIKGTFRRSLAPTKGNAKPNADGGGGADEGSETFDPLYTAIHQSILSGFLSNIARKKDKYIFQATKDREVMIFPGSVVFEAPGAWIVAAEMVETSRLFARVVANIDIGWVEALGKAQCRYTYRDPHWERNRGEVMATEQVTLFGLIINAGRPVSYGRINPKEAFEIFVRSALVAGDVRKPFPFMTHNQELVKAIREMENKVRRRDLLAGEEEMVSFYQERLEPCSDIRSLQKHLKVKGDDSHLRMKQEDLLRYAPDKDELSLFPSRITLGSNRFDLNYRFDPGKPKDGVTIKVPSSIAPTIDPNAIDWLVPGLYREKILMLIRGLPKSYRKQLVPVSDTVDRIVAEMPVTETALLTTLGNFIHKRFGVDIPASVWPDDQLPDHLKARISIRGPKGEELRSGRDPAILTHATPPGRMPAEVESAKKQWEKTGITRWNFGDIPNEITIKTKRGTPWVIYPGLEKGDADTSVNLRLFQNKNEAIASHRRGVVILFSNHFSKDLKFLRKLLILPGQMRVKSTWLGSPKQFEQRLYQRILETLFSRNIRSKEAFDTLAEQLAPSILKKGKDCLDRVVPVIDAYHETSRMLHDLGATQRFNTRGRHLLETMGGQLKQLVPATFMELYDEKRFLHIPRYLRAIEIRAERALIDIKKDRQKAAEVDEFTNRLNDLLAALPPSVSAEKTEALEEFFWMIEEFKVSLFAQELKTAGPVSKKRLETKLGEVQRMV